MMRYLPAWCYYSHQGMVSALTMQGIVGYFRHAGFDLAHLSWLSVAMLPWVVKFLWAPWLERHSRPFAGQRHLGSLAALQLAMAAGIAGIGLLTPARGFDLLVPALMLLSLLSASHGVLANGILIGGTDDRSRPFANAAQVGGSYLGIPLGSLLFLAAAERWNWSVGLACVALCSCLLLVPPLLATQGDKRLAAERPSDRPRLDIASLRDLWPALLLTAIFYLAMRGVLALQTVMITDQGYDLATIGRIVMIYSTIASGTGVVLGGWFARHFPPRHGLPAVMALHAATIAAMALGFPLFGPTGWIAAFAFVNVIAAIGFVMLYNALMALVRPHQPASDYALFQSTDMAVAMIATLATLQVAHHGGYRVALTILATLAATLPWPAIRLLRRLFSPHPVAGRAPLAEVTHV